MLLYVVAYLSSTYIFVEPFTLSLIEKYNLQITSSHLLILNSSGVLMLCEYLCMHACITIGYLSQFCDYFQVGIRYSVRERKPMYEAFETGSLESSLL